MTVSLSTTFGDLKARTGQQKLNTYLADKSYLAG
jgi:hypothetical protein